MRQTLTIATRQSPLALWQAEHVKNRLEILHPDLHVVLNKMTTQGDKILHTPLSKIGGKGLFIKELEQGMLDGVADIAVHSMKDVPYQMPPEFELGAILSRENPFDAFVSNQFKSIDDLPQNATVGTCSMRRLVQLKAYRPDLQILDLRGNVNTRLQKLDDGNFDAIILACAGLIRLNFAHRITQELSANQSLPAVGQGAVGIEIRAGDAEILDIIRPLIDEKTTHRLTAERAMNTQLEGGCSVPIAGFATLKNETLTLTGLVGDIHSDKILRYRSSASINAPIFNGVPVDGANGLGLRVATGLIELGARDLLRH